MLEIVRHREQYGRPWCMLSLLYSPDCVFSAKMAETFFNIAKFFPKLLVVAVDVSTSSRGSERYIYNYNKIFVFFFRLITQFGIVSTPVITLWENGYAMTRIYDESLKLETLSKFILSKTDLPMVNLSKNALKNNTTIYQKDNLINENKTVKESEQENKWIKGIILTKEEFLNKFRYLKDEKEFDW